MSQFSALEIIAIVLLSYYALKLLGSLWRGLWSCFLGHFLGKGVKWRSGEGVWAVITGATDGIGLAYAKQLASKGYSLMIISRNEDKLKSVAKSLTEQYHNCKEVRTLAVDFNGTDIYDKISDELNKLEDIDVLVNNVGIVWHLFEYFLNIPKSFNDSYINVNMLSATKMHEIVLPKMVEKRRGIIINISSAASDGPIPLFATYAATKAYVTHLSEALSVEYESKGIIIQTVQPNQVETNLTKDIHVSAISVTPDSYASHAIKTVGIETRTYGHPKHKLIAYMTEIIVSLIGQRLFMKFTLNSLKDVRSKFYKNNNIQPLIHD